MSAAAIFLAEAERYLLRGDDAGALQMARMGLSVLPEAIPLLELAGICAERLAEPAQAAEFWQRILAVDPRAASAANHLGLALERLGDGAAAEAAYRQALAIVPEDGHVLANLGLLLQNQGRLSEAVAALRRAAASAPLSAEIQSNLGGALERAGDSLDAETCYRDAIRIDPKFAIAHGNLGVLLCGEGRDAEGEACFRHALTLTPDSGDLQANLGQLLLSQERFAEGWPIFEGRLLARGNGRAEMMARAIGCPRWQGEALTGKTVLVVPEQGMGDEIQFCRYLRWLKNQGTARVIYLCRPEQLALMHTLDGPDTVADLREAAQYFPQADYWAFLMSLPGLSGIASVADIPPAPYLQADPEREARLAPLLTGEGRKVGIVWRGNPEHSNDADRSLAGPEVLVPLWSVPGVRFFSFQKSPLALPPAPPGQPWIDLGPHLGDFADTAAALRELDLLICVDTSVAHLAGALGVPCWVLLPQYKTDWRWFRARADSPWYPSLRLFRQTQRGDWAMPIAEIVSALASEFKS